MPAAAGLVVAVFFQVVMAFHDPRPDYVYGVFTTGERYVILLVLPATACLGGPLLGVAVGRWLRFPGAALLVAVALFLWSMLAGYMPSQQMDASTWPARILHMLTPYTAWIDNNSDSSVWVPTVGAVGSRGRRRGSRSGRSGAPRRRLRAARCCTAPRGMCEEAVLRASSVAGAVAVTSLALAVVTGYSVVHDSSERGHRGGRLHDAAASTPVTALVGRKVLRAAPWPVLLGGCVAAATLVGIAAALRNGPLVFPLSLLGLGLCGATAAYVLDEDSAEVEDATPTGRRARVGWRLVLALLPFAVGATAVLLLAGAGGVAGWGRLVPVAAGSVAAGIAFASGLRRTGRFAPGDLAGALAFGVVVLVVANEPLHWVSLAPLESSTYPLSTAVAWSIVLLACAAVLGACERDPGRPPI